MKSYLPAEQHYICEAAESLGIEAKVVQHESPTVTCKEKAELLGWPEDQVIKTVYFKRGGDVIGVVSPGSARIDIEEVISGALPDVSRKQARNYVPNFIPSGMMKGTCTPFPYETCMFFEINRLIVCDCPSIDDKVVDISVGGCDDDALKTSMHLPYGAIYSILSEKFEDQVFKFIPKEVDEYESGFAGRLRA